MLQGSRWQTSTPCLSSSIIAVFAIAIGYLVGSITLWLLSPVLAVAVMLCWQFYRQQQSSVVSSISQVEQRDGVALGWQTHQRLYQEAIATVSECENNIHNVLRVQEDAVNLLGDSFDGLGRLMTEQTGFISDLVKSTDDAEIFHSEQMKQFANNTSQTLERFIQSTIEMSASTMELLEKVNAAGDEGLTGYRSNIFSNKLTRFKCRD